MYATLYVRVSASGVARVLGARGQNALMAPPPPSCVWPNIRAGGGGGGVPLAFGQIYERGGGGGPPCVWPNIRAGGGGSPLLLAKYTSGGGGGGGGGGACCF